MRQTLRPMLAVGGELPADDGPWAYEMKWDGIRALAHLDSGQAMLVSRTGRDVSGSYPELQGLAKAVGEHQVVLDGEIVAFGPDGWPSFEVLQQRMNVSSPSQVRQLAAEVSVSYLAFDLLSSGGESLLDRPYRARREHLEALGLEGSHWQTPPAFIGVSGADIRAVSRQHSLEGIMAKRLESRYEPGKRSSAWRKIKNVFRQEVVVGGWKPGEGMRASLLGSLIVGVYDGAGNHGAWCTPVTSAPASPPRPCNCSPPSWRRCAARPHRSARRSRCPPSTHAPPSGSSPSWSSKSRSRSGPAQGACERPPTWVFAPIRTRPTWYANNKTIAKPLYIKRIALVFDPASTSRSGSQRDHGPRRSSG